MDRGKEGDKEQDGETILKRILVCEDQLYTRTGGNDEKPCRMASMGHHGQLIIRGHCNLTAQGDKKHDQEVTRLGLLDPSAAFVEHDILLKCLESSFLY